MHNTEVHYYQSSIIMSIPKYIKDDMWIVGRQRVTNPSIPRKEQSRDDIKKVKTKPK